MASDPPTYQKYGVPLYGASWVPLNAIRSTDAKSGDGDESSPAVNSNPSNYLVLTGGGGEGRSGIPNELLLAEFDFAATSLSERPSKAAYIRPSTTRIGGSLVFGGIGVVRLGTGAELPYRMAVHPSGEGLICSLPKSCRWYDWDMPGDTENGKLGLRTSDKVLSQLEDVGQQLTLAFNEDGSLLAVGGEDGKLRVFKWPSLEILLNEEEAYTAVKDLHFSVDGKYLVSVGSGGPCRVWDVTASKVVASLQKENDEIFGFCRFSQNNDGNQVLYTIANQSKGGSIILWNTSSWKRIASKQIVHDPVSAFKVSVDGKLLAIGTIQGDIVIIGASKMRAQMNVKKAHLGLVTALTFSSDSRALGSASLDSSVRVTMIEDKIANGFNYWIIVLMILLAIAVYSLNNKGLIPERLHFL